MLRPTQSVHTLGLAFVLAVALPAVSLAQDAPLQAELAVTIDDEPHASTVKVLDGGTARVRIRVSSANETTARVIVRFGYSIPPDTIAFDEIIDLIRIETETLDEETSGRVEIDPNEINLNPNGRALRYQVMLNRPAGTYRTRVLVFGNYE
jgi:hypothetical protein